MNDYTQFVDETGKPTPSTFPAFARDASTLLEMYRLMVRTRVFDAKAIALQRTGQLGTYPSCLGQEAVGAGCGIAMQPKDVLLPTYREQAAQFARGVTMTEVLLYWGGDERGSDFAVPREDFPACVPIASQACHAVGVATAFKLRDEPRVAVCACGDGATSKGDFYEAINLAGVWRLPVVFVVTNNQWAISVPRHDQSASPTLAAKAVAAGFHGGQVDGNDVIAVRATVEQALERARSGGGASLLEMLSYRLHDHTTADDASRYRTEAEVERAWQNEPIARMRAYLTECELWSQGDEDALIAECNEAVQQAADEYLATPPQPAQSMFDWLYAALPAALTEQRAAVSGGEQHG